MNRNCFNKTYTFLVFTFFSLTLSAQVGGVDCSFNNGTQYGKITTDFNGFHEMGNAMKVYKSGSYLDYIVITGGADHTDGTTEYVGVTRYKPDGELDTSFGGDGKVMTDISGSTYDRGRAVGLYTDGKVVVAVGTSTDKMTVVRYLANGSLDTSFGSGGIVTHSIGTSYSYWQDAEIQSDGKIILVGQRRDSNYYRSVVIRLNSNGSVDSTFGGSTGVGVDLADDNVGELDYGMESFSKVKIDSNGDIWTCGWARQIEGASKTNRATFARISSTGSIITSGVVNLGYGSESCGGIDISGTSFAYIGGYTNDSEGERDLGIAKLFADGSLDTSFDGDGKVLVEMGGSDEFRGLAIQGDGKIVVTSNTYGDFAVARLNSDGTLDSSFSDDGINLIDFGDDDRPYGGVQLQSTGKIILGGWSGSSEERNFAVTRVIAEPTDMALCGVEVNQNTLPIEPATKGDILRMNIEVSGTLNPFSASGFIFSTSGTDDTSDISSAELFYTGSSETYAETTSLGSSSYPDGSFDFPAFQALQAGSNYFWLSYEIPEAATSGNLADATALQVTIDGSNLTLNNAPEGAREINYIALLEDFGETDGAAFPAGWTAHDEDGDGRFWSTSEIDSFGSPGKNGAGVGSESWYSNNLTPDNWLVSEVVDLTDYASATLEYWIGAIHDSYGKENMQVYISTSGNTPADFTGAFGALVDSYTTADSSWVKRRIDLSAYAGQAFYIAWRHNQSYADENWAIRLDEISVIGPKNTANQAPTLSTITKSANQDTDINFAVSDFSGAFSDPDSDQMAMIKIISLPSNGTLEHNGSTFAVPYEIDPSSFGTFIYSPNSSYAGSDTFKWNASDGTEYAVTDADANIALSDSEDPVISSCPGDINENADSGTCDAVVNWTEPTATDNVGVTGFTNSHNSGDTFSLGTTNVIYSADDAAGNNSTCTFDITVSDNQNPAIVCPSNIAVDSDAGACGAVVNFTEPVGTDNCSASTNRTAGFAPGSTFPVGTTTQTYVVTDGSSNSATCSFTVTVNDVESPEITCPDITVDSETASCGKVVSFTAPEGTDNCGGSSTTQTGGLSSGSTFPKGSTVQTFKVTDSSGKTAECSFTVTVNDATDPAATCPADQTVELDDACTASLPDYTVLLTSSDNCDSSLSIAQSPVAGTSTSGAGTNVTVNQTATDDDGNIGSCSFNVTAIDNIDPAIVCPSNITVDSAAGTCGAVVNFSEPMGTDNCSASTIRTAGVAPGSTFPVGTTTQTYVVTDGSSNSATCSFTVTVNDVESPEITCPSDITVASESSSCGKALTFTAPEGTDNCGGSSTERIEGLSSGSTFPKGSTVQTFKVTDSSGKTAECSFTVTVNDATDPAATCPVDQTVELDGVCTASLPDYTGIVTSNDNCDSSVSVSQSPMSGTTISGAGSEVTISETATDDDGNDSACSFKVTAIDNTDPSIVCPSNITVDSAAGTCGAVVNFTEPAGTDNCSASTNRTAGVAPGSTFPVGTTTQTYVVTDGSSNSATCSFTVTVNDVESPEITCPSDITVASESASCGKVVSFTAPEGTDNCGGSSTTQTGGLSSGSTFPKGPTVQTFKVTDSSGKTAECSFTVTVNDATDPTATCPADQTVELGSTCRANLPDFSAEVTTGDNCDTSLSTEQTPPVGTVVSGAGTEVTVTENVTDDDSNSSSCSFKVTAVDNIDPEINCPSNINVDNDSGVCGAVVNFTEPVGTDNCSASTIRTAGLAPGSTFPVGTTTQTYVVTDTTSNSAQCSFTVTVNDAENPTITCPQDMNEPYQSATTGAIVTFNDPQINDNCSVASLSRDSGLSSGSEFPVGSTENGFSVTDSSGNSANCSFRVTVAAPSIVVNEIDYDSNGNGATEFIELYNSGSSAINLDLFEIKLVDGDGNEIYGTVNLPDFELESDSFYVICADGNSVENCNLQTSLGNNFIQNGAPDAVALKLSNILIDTVSYEGDAGSPYTETEGISERDPDFMSLASISRFPNGKDTNNNKLDFLLSVPSPGKRSVENKRPAVTDISFVIDQDTELELDSKIFEQAYSDPDNQELIKVAVTSLPAHGKLFDNGVEITAFPYEISRTALNMLSYIPQNSFAGSDSFGWNASDGFHYAEIGAEVNITVNDTESPVITSCPANIEVSNSDNSCNVKVVWTTPIAADNVGVSSFTGNHTSGESFQPGTTAVTYSATDTAGNSSECTFDVTVKNRDSDGDGEPDCTDGCDSDPQKTAPGICGCGVSDDDTDGDGNADCKDLCPDDPAKIAPGFCGCGIGDTDTDNDGVPDCIEECDNDPLKTEAGICGCGIADTDSDGDGTADCEEECDSDPLKTVPGICGCGIADTDSDGDGTADCEEECDSDPLKTVPGICGCGITDADWDEDGTPDCIDKCVEDPFKTSPGICGCGVPDTDSDGDGAPDCNEQCDNDPFKTEPGICGCGIADTDSDGDGTADCKEECDNDPLKTEPGICGCGVPDTDTDGDGTPACNEECDKDPLKTEAGICGCGIADTDSDGDGTPDCNDLCADDPAKIEPGVCGCGVVESDVDTDGDGTADCIDECDKDPGKTEPGICGCGIADTDSDGDGIADCIDICEGHDDSADADGDGVPDGCDNDFTGSCDSTVPVTALPYENSVDTAGRTPHISSYGENCGGTDQPGAEIVYEYTASSDLEIEITVTTDAEIDPAIRIVKACGEDNDCVGSADEGSSGATETIAYSMASGETVFIIVEQMTELSGAFTISIMEVEKEEDDDYLESPDSDSDEDNDETVDETPDDDEDTISQECKTITIGSIDASDNPETMNTYYAKIQSAIGEILVPDRLMLQFKQNGTGTFDLGTGKNTNYQSCDQCLLVFEDLTEKGAVKTYFQQSGNINVTEGTVMDGESAGSVISAKLVEVTIDPETSKSTLVPGGACIEMQSATWDTTKEEPVDEDHEIVTTDEDDDEVVDIEKSDEEIEDIENPIKDEEEIDPTDKDNEDVRPATSGCSCSMII